MSTARRENGCWERMAAEPPDLQMQPHQRTAASAALVFRVQKRCAPRSRVAGLGRLQEVLMATRWLLRPAGRWAAKCCGAGELGLWGGGSAGSRLNERHQNKGIMHLSTEGSINMLCCCCCVFFFFCKFELKWLPLKCTNLWGLLLGTLTGFGKQSSRPCWGQGRFLKTRKTWRS